MISQYKPFNTTLGDSLRVAKLVLFAIAMVVVIAVFASPVQAFIAEEVSAASNLQQGTLVSIKENEPGYVELADADNAARLYGVVQDGDYASIKFSSKDSNISVATSGEVVALVSDVNGEIKKGDIVGASWIKGVGMKTDSSLSGRYLGVALENMNSAQATTYEDIETPSGNKEIKVQVIKVRMLSGNLEGRIQDVSTLQKFAGNLTGKNISTLRVAIAFIVFVISLTLCGLFVTNAIRGSFLSIGRNPLASSSIYSSLVQVSVMSIVIIVIGAVVAYAILLF